MWEGKRHVHQSFLTTTSEDAIIHQKMERSGIQRKSVFFRAMVLNGYLLKLDLTGLRELLRLMKNLTNNVNQIARRLNERGSIYETEIDEIKERLDEIWDLLNELLTRLEPLRNGRE